MSPGTPQMGHTPGAGTWRALDGDGQYLSDDDWGVDYDGDCTWVHVMDGEQVVAIVVAPGMDRANRVGRHAHLIAAAPDLLAALRDLMAIADPDGEATDIWAASARAAIARASGGAA